MLGRSVAWLAQHWHRLALAVLAGVLYFTGFVGFDQWYLAWICLAPILWALDDARLSGRDALIIAWVFGLTTHLGGYPWIIGLLVEFAYLPLPAAFLGYVLLCWGQGSLLAFWGWLWHRAVHRHGAPRIWAAAAIMAVTEWLYPLIFQSYLSNSQYRQTLVIQSLDLWGPIGITFLLTLSSAVLFEIFAARRRGAPPPRLAIAVLIALIVGNLAYGAWRVDSVEAEIAAAPRKIKVGLVQTNIGMVEKTRNPAEGLRRHREQSVELQNQGADLIVWPESGYYYPIVEGTKNVQERVMGPELRTPLIFGAIRVDRSGTTRKVYNSSFLLNGAGDILGTYDKVFLLAFGEYIPFGDWFPKLYEWSPNATHFEHGTRMQPVTLDGIRYAIDICYEDILPELLRAQMQYEPHVLVNITNDSWYGETHEPLIHLALAGFRAVETRRYLVRSTNTGISAVIDPLGRFVEETDIYVRANILSEIAPLEGKTLYVRLGNWVGMLSLAALAWWLRGLANKLLRAGPTKPARS